MLDFKKNKVEDSKLIQTSPENHCVVQICLWCFYTETRKIVCVKKKKNGPCALALLSFSAVKDRVVPVCI